MIVALGRPTHLKVIGGDKTACGRSVGSGLLHTVVNRSVNCIQCRRTHKFAEQVRPRTFQETPSQPT